MKVLQKLQKKKAFPNSQKNSEVLQQLKNTMKKDTELYLKMLKQNKYLKKVKLKCGNAEIAVI